MEASTLGRPGRRAGQAGRFRAIWADPVSDICFPVTRSAQVADVLVWESRQKQNAFRPRVLFLLQQEGTPPSLPADAGGFAPSLGWVDHRAGAGREGFTRLAHGRTSWGYTIQSYLPPEAPIPLPLGGIPRLILGLPTRRKSAKARCARDIEGAIAAPFREVRYSRGLQNSGRARILRP